MRPVVERLGASALISHRTDPAGLAYRLVEASADAEVLVYELDGVGRTLPAAGESVHCWSDTAGQWTSTVREVHANALLLDRPTWLGRPQPRQHVRVEASINVRLFARGSDVAGRLVDVSAQGSALLVESVLAPMPGAQVDVALPRGDRVTAVVRSRRGHANRLLRVVGLQWLDGDERALAWLDGELSRALARYRPSRAAQ